MPWHRRRERTTSAVPDPADEARQADEADRADRDRQERREHRAALDRIHERIDNLARNA